MPGFKVKFTRVAPTDSAASQRAASPQAAPPAARSTAAQPPASPSVAANSEPDSLARERILNSPEWQKTQQAYNEWLSVQKIYTPAEVKKLKADTAAKIAKMSARSCRTFSKISRRRSQC